MKFLFVLIHATAVVPLPMNGSKTTSLAELDSANISSIQLTFFSVGCNLSLALWTDALVQCQLSGNLYNHFFGLYLLSFKYASEGFSISVWLNFLPSVLLPKVAKIQNS